jgi:uncharacterized membrane protein YqgA involved in biofilm formation
MQTVPLNIPFIAKLEATPLFLVIVLNIMIGVVIGGTIAALKNMKRYVKETENRRQVSEMKKRLSQFEDNTLNIN